jgi:fused signal recognition particle receptor
MTKTELKGEKLDSILLDLKINLLKNDVALSVADQICNDVKKRLDGLEVGWFEDKKNTVKNVLKETLLNILIIEDGVSLLNIVAEKKNLRKPLIILFIGINGSGKTTTIAKIGKLLLDKGYSVVIACGDTYRAGSIEQLEEHAKRLGVHSIKHRYGADAAAVAFDAINHAKARKINAVLIDTAGRMQTNKNLMEEMRKIVRIAKPDLIVFVGDALTGNDAVTQAEEFNQYVPIDASILTKVDADAKGGAAISLAYITKKPTIYFGTGQKYSDLVSFDANLLIEKIIE